MIEDDKKIGLRDKIPFGKHKGQIVAEVMMFDLGYFTWMDETSELLLEKFKEEVYLKYVSRTSYQKQAKYK